MSLSNVFSSQSVQTTFILRTMRASIALFSRVPDDVKQGIADLAEAESCSAHSHMAATRATGRMT